MTNRCKARRFPARGQHRNTESRAAHGPGLLALCTVTMIVLCFLVADYADAAAPYEEGNPGSGQTIEETIDEWVQEEGTVQQQQQWQAYQENGLEQPDVASSESPNSFALRDVPRTGPKLASGYVMTHEHPMVGMAFGGNYAYAGDNSNYVHGMPDDAYSQSCSGCGNSKCDHAEVKGWFIGPKLGQDMGNHSSHRGPYYDSFSHLRYSSEWIQDAHSPPPPYNDSRMKIMVAFAVENEAMCELLHEANKGGGGPGGGGFACTTGDSVQSLERQLDNMKSWAAANDDWVEIAYTAAEARSIVNADKLAIVLAIEADYAWGAEDRSFDPVNRLDRYYDDGVRTFYLAHKVNSRLAGADVYHDKNSPEGKQIRAMQGISGCLYYDDNVGHFPLRTGKLNPTNLCDNEQKCGEDALKGPKVTDKCVHRIGDVSEVNAKLWMDKGDGDFNGFDIYPRPPGFDDSAGGSRMVSGVERNNLSLSQDGSRVVLEAMRRGMIMNLDHVSSDARSDIFAHSQEYYNYPVNALHNNPNEMLVEPAPNEYDFDKSERKFIKDSGGIFGVRLGPINAKSYGDSGVGGSGANCTGTSTENAKVLAYLIDEGQRIGYSLDFATVTKGTMSRTKGGCLDLGDDYLSAYAGNQVTQGIAHIGNMRAWHMELESIGMKKRYVNRLKNKGAEHFLRMWEKSEFIARLPSVVAGIL